MSPSGLLVRTGSVGVSFIIWLACGLLSLLGKYFSDIYVRNVITVYISNKDYVHLNINFTIFSILIKIKIGLLIKSHKDN